VRGWRACADLYLHTAPRPLTTTLDICEDERRGRKPVGPPGRVFGSLLADLLNSWRRPGPQGNRNTQDRTSGTSTPTKDNARQQAGSAQSGNAWGGKGKGAGSGQASGPADRHVPVRDFNANEVKDFLKQSTFYTCRGVTEDVEAHADFQQST
jgi:hypothetical protein